MSKKLEASEDLSYIFFMITQIKIGKAKKNFLIN